MNREEEIIMADIRMAEDISRVVNRVIILRVIITETRRGHHHETLEAHLAEENLSRMGVRLLYLPNPPELKNQRQTFTNRFI
jgi:hypothetical protein